MSNPYDAEPGQPDPSDANAHGQPGGYGPPPGYGAPAQAPNDGVSIAGFVLSLLCCTSIIGLILGAVGLSRTKNGQRRGRGLAIAAVIIGIVGTLLFIGGVVVVIWIGKNMVLPETTRAGQCVSVLFEDGGTTYLRKVDCADADGKVAYVGEYREITSLPDPPNGVDQLSRPADAEKACRTFVAPAFLEEVPENAEWGFMTSVEGEPDGGDLFLCYYLER